MTEQFGVYDLVHGIQERIEEATRLRCYDTVPQDAPAPFYICRVTGSRPMDSKTMYITAYTVQLHAIAPDTQSSLGVFEMLQNSDEAMTDLVEVPEGFHVVLQRNLGLVNNTVDPSGEPHAITQWEIRISYGFKIK